MNKFNPIKSSYNLNFFQVLLFAVFISLSLFSQSFIAFGESFQSINVSDSIGESNRPQIFAYNNTLHMVWTDKFEGNSEIYYSQVDTEFQNLSKPINLSNNQGASAFPRIYVENDIIYVTWYDYSPGQSDVFFAKSIDGGKTFSVQNLSNDQKASYNPWIAATGKNVYVIWNDGGKSQELEISGEKRIVDVLMGDMDIYFAKSDDYGDTFEIKNISNNQGESVNSRIRINDNNIFSVWSDDKGLNSEIYFSKSDNFGLNFTSPINISNSINNSFDSGISVTKDSVYVIWKESYQNQTDIYFSKSSDYGKTFDSAINISKDQGESIITRDTQMAVNKDNVFVVFSTELGENEDVFISTSRDKGKTFETPINLSNNPAKSTLPQIHVSNDKLFVIWIDDSSGNSDILLRQSTDLGHSFGPIKNITNDSANSLIFVLGPQITSVDNHTFVLWENKSNTDDLFLTSIPIKPESGYVFDVNNQRVDIKLDIKENDLQVPIELIFSDPNSVNNEIDVPFKMIIKDKNGNKIIDNAEMAYKGNFADTVSFPKKGEYLLFIEPINAIDSNRTSEETPSIIVNVIPEFSSAIIVFAVTFIFILMGKNYNKIKV